MQPSATSIYLILTALLLGFRHAIDWDHIAALVDLSTPLPANTMLPNSPPMNSQHVLPTMYALGHALSVAALSLGLRLFAVFIPAWLDGIIERIVGLTLVALGYLIVVNAVKSRDGSAVAVARQTPFTSLRRRNAFGLGIVHGLGAETSTQVALITGAGATASWNACLYIIAAFCGGLLICNCIIGLLLSFGFAAAVQLKRLALPVSLASGIFSIVVGLRLLVGTAPASFTPLGSMLGGG